jgi:hypothetical protein
MKLDMAINAFYQEEGRYPFDLELEIGGNLIEFAGSGIGNRGVNSDNLKALEKYEEILTKTSDGLWAVLDGYGQPMWIHFPSGRSYWIPKPGNNNPYSLPIPSSAHNRDTFQIISAGADGKFIATHSNGKWYPDMDYLYTKDNIYNFDEYAIRR